MPREGEGMLGERMCEKICRVCVVCMAFERQLYNNLS